MSESEHHRNDPYFLLSRSMDEELSAEERRVLEDALARSDDLRAAAKQWPRLHEIVRSWSRAHPDVDTEPYVKYVVARLGDTESDVKSDTESNTESNAASTDVDALLKRWSQEGPDYDDESFVQGVMDRLGQAETRSVRRWGLRRFALPLAAAAALVFAVVGVLRLGVKDRGHCMVEYQGAIGVAARGSSASADKAVVVTFVREQDRLRLKSSDMRLAFVSFSVDGPMAELRITPPPL